MQHGVYEPRQRSVRRRGQPCCPFARTHRLYRPDSRRSSEGAKKVRPPAAPRGTMEILVTGSYSGMRAPTWVVGWVGGKACWAGAPVIAACDNLNKLQAPGGGGAGRARCPAGRAGREAQGGPRLRAACCPPHQRVAGLVVGHQPLLLLAHHGALLLGASDDALQGVGDLVLHGQTGLDGSECGGWVWWVGGWGSLPGQG